MAARGWPEGRATVAFPGCCSIAVEARGPCCSEGKSPAAALRPGGLGQQGSGFGEQVDAQLAVPLLRRLQGDCKAVKHPLQHDKSSSSLLSREREGTSLQDPGCWDGSVPRMHTSVGCSTGLHLRYQRRDLCWGGEGSRERGRDTPVGNLLGHRDTNPAVPCSIEGHFYGSGSSR